jgi:hypothetical protein
MIDVADSVTPPSQCGIGSKETCEKGRFTVTATFCPAVAVDGGSGETAGVTWGIPAALRYRFTESLTSDT